MDKKNNNLKQSSVCASVTRTQFPILAVCKWSESQAFHMYIVHAYTRYINCTLWIASSFLLSFVPQKTVCMVVVVVAVIIVSRCHRRVIENCRRSLQSVFFLYVIFIVNSGKFSRPSFQNNEKPSLFILSISAKCSQNFNKYKPFYVVKQPFRLRFFLFLKLHKSQTINATKISNRKIRWELSRCAWFVLWILNKVWEMIFELIAVNPVDPLFVCHPEATAFQFISCDTFIAKMR